MSHNLQVAVRADGLSKRYRIGAAEARHETIVGSVGAALRSPFTNWRNVRNLSRFGSEGDADLVWAVKDVSFEIGEGEVVGIIGRNGAGKSTLLKILCRITDPTAGRAEIFGRIGSLLEVGTGFHPDLTGRENVYINGTILGMRKREIDQRFEEIVEFAEVARFIDTPVKRYSTGMRVRLAFSVAAHLQPEILIVDEVLAVGDIEFQRKCIGKMGDVARQGRTVLFVSHNMAAVRRLCGRCILLSDGAVKFDGTCEEGIGAYQKQSNEVVPNPGPQARLIGSGTRGRIVTVGFRDDDGVDSTTFGIGESVTVVLQVELHERLRSAAVGLELSQVDGLPLLNLRTDAQGISLGPYETGDSPTFRVRIPSLPFYPGAYEIKVWIAERGGNRIDQIGGFRLNLEPAGRYQSELLIQAGRGVVVMDCNWGVE